MSNNSDGTNLVVLILITAFAILAYIIFSFANAINVNAETSISIIGRGTLIIILSAILIKTNITSWLSLTPAILSGLAWAFLPALNYWAINDIEVTQYSAIADTQKWYSYWYSKIGLVSLPSIIGYTIRFIFSK